MGVHTQTHTTLSVKGEILYQDFVSKHLAILSDVKCFIAGCQILRTIKFVIYVCVENYGIDMTPSKKRLEETLPQKGVMRLTEFLSFYVI